MSFPNEVRGEDKLREFVVRQLRHLTPEMNERSAEVEKVLRNPEESQVGDNPLSCGR